MSDAKAQRRPLSTATKIDRENQIVTGLLVSLVAGPITIVASVIIFLMMKQHQRRKLIVAIGSLICLIAFAACWSILVQQWAMVTEVWQQVTVYRQQHQTMSGADWWLLAGWLWPLLWLWWSENIFLAPTCALVFSNNRVKDATEIETQRRQRREAKQAQIARTARQQVDRVPEVVNEAMVLGVPLGEHGDLPWVQRQVVVYPEMKLTSHAVIIGGSNTGKSETCLRIAEGVAQTYGWKVFVLDLKGERPHAERFLHSMRRANKTTMELFPDTTYHGWHGDGQALFNRLFAVLDYSEPYYRDMVKMVLHLAVHAPEGLPTSHVDLLRRLTPKGLATCYAGHEKAEIVAGLEKQNIQAVYNRYHAFFSAIGAGFDGTWDFGSVDAGYILLDGLTLKEQTASLGRYLLEDFAHYVAHRKPPHEQVLLIIDEFPVLALTGTNTTSLFEMVRFHGASIIVTAQSYAAMEKTADRILGAATTLMLHRCGDPEQLLLRAGHMQTYQRRVAYSERGASVYARGFSTGEGLIAEQEELKVHPNVVKSLAPGECIVVAEGRYQHVLIKRTERPPDDPSIVGRRPLPQPASAAPARPLIEAVERTRPGSPVVIGATFTPIPDPPETVTVTEANHQGSNPPVTPATGVYHAADTTAPTRPVSPQKPKTHYDDEEV